MDVYTPKSGSRPPGGGEPLQGTPVRGGEPCRRGLEPIQRLPLYGFFDFPAFLRLSWEVLVNHVDSCLGAFFDFVLEILRFSLSFLVPLLLISRSPFQLNVSLEKHQKSIRKH